jgi:hypothetical protein
MIGYKVQGFDLSFYCKKSEINIGMSNYKCVLSFGAGMKKFCMTAFYDKQKNPTTIYINNVENNDLCVSKGLLSNYDKGTVKLVKTALYVIKTEFPEITKLTLKDDSQIYCEKGSKMFKMSMSYDYILKYNESWYQKHFNAILPGFISKNYISNKVNIVLEPNSIMNKYVSSLHVLDEPNIDYSLIRDSFPQFEQYKDIYESSKTPRDFIQQLRTKLGEKYCFLVGSWLNHYMIFLQIKLSPDDWYILTSTIKEVPNYKIDELDSTNAKRIFNGGNRTNKTRKQNKYTYKMIADCNFRDNCVEYYNHNKNDLD